MRATNEFECPRRSHSGVPASPRSRQARLPEPTFLFEMCRLSVWASRTQVNEGGAPKR
jgi:hypothetical protein